LYSACVAFGFYTSRVCVCYQRGGCVTLCFCPVGSPAGLRGGHPAVRAEPRPGESVQLGSGPLLHRVLPAGLRLLQGHRHRVWEQVRRREAQPQVEPHMELQIELHTEL
jgi:hypothetical protein